MGKAFGITALIFGIISIPVTILMTSLGFLSNINPYFGTELLGLVITVIGWLFPTIAIIFGILGIIFDDEKGLAIAGLVLAVVASIIALLIWLLFTDFLANITGGTVS